MIKRRWTRIAGSLSLIVLTGMLLTTVVDAGERPVLQTAVSPARRISAIPRTPPLPDTMRVIAIRVDFQPDTMETTTGDGSFFYEIPEGDDSADWAIDPPPHDSSYFADQLFAARTYFSRHSRGKLTLTGAVNSGDNSGGDVFPAGEQAAYTLPYPIWHINWADGDNDRLNTTLTQLFVDAWTLADEDSTVDVSQYDLFVIFHAGAGNEFDTGYDTTPFDIPSVAITAEDLADFVSLPNGILLSSGTVTDGVILPETQRQGDVEVGLIGTIAHQMGYLLGMPHLYDTETGMPGVGMFGLMDRGFGGFYGLIPTPPHAWTRVYMGWDSVTVVESGEVSLGAYGLPDSLFGEDLARLVKVPINENEYYLLEARYRDADEDSTTVGYDRDGRQITFHANYSYDVEEGFGVLVDVEDPDFDLPARGVLIWHIDDGVISRKLSMDALQTDENWRAIDLEEADGSQDIGNEYAYLTASYGSEYGIQQDAFYIDNDYWRLANDSYSVEFGPFTVPSSTANNGGESHISIYGFSAPNDTMTFTVDNTWAQGDFPSELEWASGKVQFTFADLDQNDSLELVLWDEAGVFRAFNADGTVYGDSILADLPDQTYQVRVIKEQPYLYLFGESAVYTLDAQTGQGSSEALSIFGTESPVLEAAVMDTTIQNATLVYLRDLGNEYVLTQEYLGMVLGIGSSIHRDTLTTTGQFIKLGPSHLDSMLFLQETGALSLIDRTTAIPVAAAILSSAPALNETENVTDPISADFDGDGIWDVAAVTSEGRIVRWFGGEGWSQGHIEEVEYPIDAIHPADVDDDGIPELVATIPGKRLIAYELNGLVSEGTPLTLANHLGSPDLEGGLFFDVDGLGGVDFAAFSTIEPGKSVIAGYNLADGRALTGFPIDFGYASGQIVPETGIVDLDGDGDLELVTLTQLGSDATQLRVIDLPARASGDPKIFWGMAEGDVNGGRCYPYASAVSVEAGTRSLTSSYIWPNPIRDNLLHLRFPGVASGKAAVRIYDLMGRLVEETETDVSAGLENEATLSVAGWASGVYVAKLEIGGEQTLIRFAVVH